MLGRHDARGDGDDRGNGDGRGYGDGHGHGDGCVLVVVTSHHKCVVG